MRRALAPLGLAAAVVAALVGAPPAAADRETAEFHARRGERALASKDLATAVEEYGKAATEDGDYLPAHVGLGDALAAQARNGEAAVAYRDALAVAERVKPLPIAWGGLVDRAKKRLAEVDAGGLAIAKIQRKYVDDLVALADRWKSKDPALAERAAKRALEVIPDDPAATERLEEGGRAGAQGAERIFDGTSFAGFVPEPSDEIWEIKDGLLRGGAARTAKGVNSGKTFDGNFDVKMEARILRYLGDSPRLVVSVAGSPDREAVHLGVFGDAVVIEHERSETGASDVRLWATLLRNLKPTFEPTSWTKYEVRLRKDDLTVLVNGNVLRKERRPKERKDGVVGLMIQDARCEVRLFEVVAR